MAKVLGFQIEIKGTERAINNSEELRRAIAEVQKELKKATDTESVEELNKTLVELKARQAEVNREIREAVKARQQELKQVDQTDGAYARLSAELNEARKRYKDLAAAQQENSDEAVELLQKITRLDDNLKSIDARVGQFQRNVGNYAGALSQFFPRLGGAIGDVGGSLEFLQSQQTRTGKGLGALLVGFTAFSAVSDVFQQLNADLEQTRLLALQISNLTGATGEDLTKQVAGAQAVAAVYKEDAKEVAVAANTLSKELGVNYGRALELIEAGYRKGANAQGEFLDQLREYPAQFRDAGASAETFLAVSIAAAREGVYSDKGLDAVKEFGLRIREQTKATRDALEGALGKQFTDGLFQNLNNGSTTAAQALGQVTRALKENGVQGAELQTVIADVFGGPGEDVGQRFLFTLGEILTTTGDVTEATSAYEKEQQELFEANLALQEAQAEYNEAFANVAVEFEKAKIKGKQFAAEALSAIFQFFNELPATIAGAQRAISTFFSTGSLKQSVQAYNKTFLGELKKIKIEDEAQKVIADQLTGPGQGGGKRVQTAAKTAGKDVAEQLVKGSVEEIEKRKGELDKAFERAVAGSDAQRAIAVNLKKVEAELKEALNRQNQIINGAEIEAVKAQVGKIVNTKELRAAIDEIQKQIERATDVKSIEALNKTLVDLRSSQAELDERAITQRIDRTTKGNEELKKLFSELTEANAREVEKQLEDNKRAFDSTRERTRQIIDASVNFVTTALDGINQFAAIQAEKRQALFDQEIEAIEAQISLLEDKQAEAGPIRRKQIEQEIKDQKFLLEIQQRNAEKAQLEAAKTEKRIAIIQATIAGALAVAKALASSIPPANFINAAAAGAAAAIQVGIIAAQPLATGGVITGRKVTDKQNVPRQRSGDNVLAFVKRGEVVLNDWQQAALGGPSTFRRIGMKGFAGGGQVLPPTGSSLSAPISAPIASNSNAVVEMLMRNIEATNQRIDRIQAFVVSDDVARSLREGEALEVAATL